MLAVHTMNEKFGIEKAKTGKSCLFLTKSRKYHIELENVRYSKQGVIYIQLDAYFARSDEIGYKFFLENDLLIINSIVMVLNISCY